MKRVKLTELGEQVLLKAQQQAGKVSQLLMGDSTDKEILFFLEKFKELDRFHTDRYNQGGFQSIDDVLD